LVNQVSGQHRNRIVRAPGGFERVEACFSGLAFAPHRHDTYAIGVTLRGVQSFDYRGAARNSLPGQLVILHPDERHDGRAGDERAFAYRTAYVAPALIQQALSGQPLPFIDDGVCGDPRLRAPIMALLSDYGRALDELELQDALYDLAMAMQAVAGAARPLAMPNRAAALRARDYIDARVEPGLSLDELEHATGHDRWQLSRDFRCLFGTSPYRYLILRRLDKARDAMLGGCSAAHAAADLGFADQSHFGRLFKQSFGLSPNVWLSATLGAHDRSIRTDGRRPN
jgi:AraC-like DNA-binding protein